MSSFVSTRGPEQASLAEAVLRGLAPDGGLYVPRVVPRLTGDPPPGGDLVAVAQWAGPTLMPEVDPEALDGLIADALSFPVPLIEVEPDVFVLELFHGPTHAFKDVGARFLARLASGLATEGATRTVLVATSGDTGGAVADAFHGVDGFRVVVLYPAGGVSDRQRRQMTTLGGNVTALEVRGAFDDCQRLAKEAFLDATLSAEHGLTSANSINVGRLLPQTLYYLSAAAALGWDDRPARFVVPSGNLGNLFAGLLARAAGMPAAGFVAAANRNRAFVDFLAGEPYAPRPSIPTTSNAMDVGAPSNFERLMWLFGGDVEELRRAVAGASVDDEEVAACIADVHARTGYVMDPHTAVAWVAAKRPLDVGGALRSGARESVDASTPGRAAPTVVLATAHPAKFPEVTERMIGREIPLPPGLARTRDREEQVIEIEPTLTALAQALSAERVRSS